MKFEEGVYQKGNARVIVKADPGRNRYHMYVLIDTPQGVGVVTMDGGSMLIEMSDPGTAIDEDDDVFLVWEAQEDITDTISDVFAAMATALGVGVDARTAREMGRLEGENHVWKQLFDKVTPPPVSTDWSKYISPNTSPGYSPSWGGGLQVTSTAGYNQPTLPDPGPMQVSHMHGHVHDINKGVPYDWNVEQIKQAQRDLAVAESESRRPEGPFGGAP